MVVSKDLDSTIRILILNSYLTILQNLAWFADIGDCAPIELIRLIRRLTNTDDEEHGSFQISHPLDRFRVLPIRLRRGSRMPSNSDPLESAA